MPTPTGRPRKGDTVHLANGELVGTVLQVTRGKVYSVRIRRPNSKFPTDMTNFPYWAKKYGWVVK